MLFIILRPTIKDAQATGEDFSPQKRISTTSKHENSLIFSVFVGHFALRDLDPETATQINEINADPCGSGSGSTTLGLTVSARSEIVLGSIPASSDSEKSAGGN